MFLIVVDAHWKWLEAFPMSTSTPSATIEKLRIAFSTHGLPEMVVTDNGSNFVSGEFEDFLKRYGVRHIRTAPYHPSSNGLAERAVQTFKEGMKKLKDGILETRVSRFLSRYRITPQTTTGVSPAELLRGRKPKSRLDLIYPEIGRKVRGSQMSQKQRRDLHVKERAMMEGDKVYARNFGQGSKWVPGVVRQSNSPTMHEVVLKDGRIWRRHQDHLIQRSCDYPSVIPWAVPEIIASESEEPKLTVQPAEDHAVSPEVPDSTEPPDVQGNSDRRYPTWNRRPPGYLRDSVSK